MPRAKVYRIQTRQPGEPWRTRWRETDEATGREGALTVSREMRRPVPDAPSIVIAVYPYVRLLCGSEVLADYTPERVQRYR